MNCTSLFLFWKVFIVIWTIGVADNIQWNEDDINEKIEFLEFCKSTNLVVLAFSDTKMNTVTVSFELLDSKYKDCFEYYYIFLKSKQEKVKECKVWNEYYKEEKFSCTLEDVTCGEYEVIIQPCYNKWECALMIIKYPIPVNMTSSDCVNNAPLSLNRRSTPLPLLTTEIIIALGVSSAILIITVSGLIYRCYWSDKRNRDRRSELEMKPVKPKILNRKVHVYIFYYYDKENRMKRRVRNMKIYLQKSSYFNSVSEIEDELKNILPNVDVWLNQVLEKEDNEGNLIKIVLVDSEVFQDEEYEIENLIYSQFIDKLSNNSLRCHTDYDNLFVVKLEGITTCSKRLCDIVRKNRLCIPRDLDDLCLSLCSFSELDDISV